MRPQFSPVGSTGRFPLMYAFLVVRSYAKIYLGIKIAALFFRHYFAAHDIDPFNNAKLSHSVNGYYVHHCILVYIGFGWFNGFSLRNRNNGIIIFIFYFW